MGLGVFRKRLDGAVVGVRSVLLDQVAFVVAVARAFTRGGLFLVLVLFVGRRGDVRGERTAVGIQGGIMEVGRGRWGDFVADLRGGWSFLAAHGSCGSWRA